MPGSIEERFSKVFQTVTGLSRSDFSVPGSIESERPLWDSITHIYLITALEEEFDFSFDQKEFREIRDYDTGLKIVAKHIQLQ